MCHFDSVVSLGVKPDNKALTSYEMFCSSFLASLLSIRLLFTICVPKESRPTAFWLMKTDTILYQRLSGGEDLKVEPIHLMDILVTRKS